LTGKETRNVCGGEGDEKGRLVVADYSENCSKLGRRGRTIAGGAKDATERGGERKEGGGGGELSHAFNRGELGDGLPMQREWEKEIVILSEKGGKKRKGEICVRGRKKEKE